MSSRPHERGDDDQPGTAGSDALARGTTVQPPGAAAKPVPAWRRQHRGEHRWPVAMAIVVAIALQLATPQNLAFDPKWLLPTVEGALLLVLLIVNPFRMNRESSAVRVAELALVAVATVAVVWSAGRLIVLLVLGEGERASAPPSGGDILISGATIWLTNVIVFALWYWQLDRGGPAARAHVRRPHPDLLFPQMTVEHLVRHDWRPVFLDYLYLSFTNSTAFSPTDTMPMARWAKVAMMLQSAVSLLVVVLVIARAVNILA